MSNTTIDVRTFIDERPMSRYQILVAVLVFLIIAFDGVDIAVMAFAAPEIIRDWAIPKQALAPVMSAVFFGLVAGALVAGPIADKLGRKLVLTTAVLAFGLFTLLGAFAQSLSTMFVLRLLAGAGLGAALPNAVTLIAEFAPERRRALMVTIVYSGFTLGATATGLVAAWLIPLLGWKAALFAAGGAPILLAIVLAVALPESPLFLAGKGIKRAAIRTILQRIDRNAALSTETLFSIPAVGPKSAGAVATILSRQFAVGTLMLWVGYFMAVFATYLLFNWMPVLTKEAGYSLANAAVVTSLFTLAGPVGSIIAGYVMDRVRPTSVLTVTFLCASALLWTMSKAPSNFGLLCALTFTLGFFVHGSATGLNAVSAKYYPTQASATGVSWMHGMGRLGGIASAFGGGIMIGWGWGLTEIFVALTGAMAIGAASVVVLALTGGAARTKPTGGLELA